MSNPELQNISQRFLTFARVEAHNVSPLYERLSRSISSDERILRLSAFSGSGQPIPNMLFAAVRFLQLKIDYKSLPFFGANGITGVRDISELYPSFRKFCLENEAEIKLILEKRRVQTNEVRRCTCLLPAFAEINKLTEGKPWTLVDVGASAGLNLNFDKYLYLYGKTIWGDINSKVGLDCEVRGERSMQLHGLSFNIGQRIGIDINPLDVNNEDDILWLRALIWPDQAEREMRLVQALEIAKETSFTMVRGDATKISREILEGSRKEDIYVFFSSFAFNQLSQDNKKNFFDLLKEYGRIRNIFLLTMGFSDQEHVELKYFNFRNGKVLEHILAICDPYGKWIDFVGNRHNE